MINYQAPKLTNYSPSKKSRSGVLGTIAGGVAQFGIGMANAWSKADDAGKAKFPEWFKKVAGYEAKPTVSVIEPTKELSKILPVSEQSTYVPVDTTLHPDMNTPEVSSLSDAPQPDLTPLPVEKSDYESAWSEGEGSNNADVEITPIEENESIHPVDLAGNN